METLLKSSIREAVEKFMPIYEYTCKKCGAHMEAMQKISDKPLARHAKCGGKLEKEWSRTGFQFKGTGWYVTDYAGKSKDAKDASESKEAKSDSSESKKSDSSESKKSDSSESKKSDSSESKTKSSESKSESKDAKSSESKGAKKSSSAPASGGGD